MHFDAFRIISRILSEKCIKIHDRTVCFVSFRVYTVSDTLYGTFYHIKNKHRLNILNDAYFFICVMPAA